MRAPVPQGKNLYVDYVYVLNFICVCVCGGVSTSHTPWHPCGGQRTIFESCFIPSAGDGTQASSLDSKHL